MRLGKSVARDLVVLALRLSAAEEEERDLNDLLKLARSLSRGVEAFQAAAVQDARDEGATWGDVAQAAALGSATARARWPAGDVTRRLKKWEAEMDLPRTPDRGHKESAGLDGTASGADAAARAREGVRRALAQLHEVKGTPQSDLSQVLEVSTSYVSRIFSGERLPDWRLLCTLVETLGGEPADLRVLWEVAKGFTPPRRWPREEAMTRLHSVLRGLHIAAGRPAVAVIRQRADVALAEDLIERMLSGREVPDWETVSVLIKALNGHPEDFAGLWQDVDYNVLIASDGGGSTGAVMPVTSRRARRGRRPGGPERSRR
ncbi:helix-turn-helix domain-containing protein [Streptomyces specialis]|uniref:helix-turn-helix domain-containing protein n=1 Tax=Streptomyces specialis TaxID=498367 RepID=UPI00073F9703|nr:helix-turn-helix transcriptional regulator [Streptomyces specialis]